MAQPNDEKVLYDFEGDLPSVLRPTEVRLKLVREQAPQGAQSLQIEFLGGEWPNLYFRADGTPWDWSAYNGLCITVHNPSTESVQFGVRVDDDPRADGALYCRQGWGTVEPGKTRTFVLPLSSADPMSIGMRGLPNPRPDVQSIALTATNELRTQHIVAFQVFMHRPKQPTTLVIDNIRLVRWLPDLKDLRDIVDEYGQYTGADWLGKVKRLEDFKEHLAEEERNLSAHPNLPEYDEYGGWKQSPTLRATGFFRTEKVNGKWWLVTPKGTLFLSIGMDCVRTDDATMVTGREHLFRWLPKDDDPLTHHRWFQTGVIRGPVKEGTVYAFYRANLQRKYGENYTERWTDITARRLRSWGFNTIGSWSSWERFRNAKIPYTVIVHPHGDHARVSSGIDYWGEMHDPFDPRFEQSVRRSLEPVTQQVGDDPYCIGYFVDNELSWTGGLEAGGLYGLAFGALNRDASDSPAKRAFVDQLRSKYDTIQALNQAWQTEFESWGALEKPVRLTATRTEAQRQDFGQFVRTLAERYFSTVRKVLRELTPNHLYLGARFAWAHPAIIQVAAQHCDLISFNIYAKEVGIWDHVLMGLDKPVLVGEFHFGALDRGMFHTGLVSATSQAHRAELYRNYLYSMADHPMFVGCHWFQYVDQPTTGRWFDGENYNIGFVNTVDYPYPEMVAMARRVHRELYARRYGKPTAQADSTGR